jgi:peptidoglycan/xylan/chitin deacetylase (PgdA/CDA1 family)
VSRVAAIVALTALVAAPARAGNWSTPAGGGSASGDPEVLLTFDDGPHHKTTGKVLDVLKARGLSAVFFLTGDHFEKGNAEKPRALVKRMLAEGHVIANHTMTHAQLCNGKPEAAAWQIDEARSVLEQEAGMPVPWFRAPYGAWCPRLVEQLGERGITHFYWDIDPQEWRTGSAKATEKRVTWALRRLQGRAILLMHDTKTATVKALPKILDWIDAENARRVKDGKRPIRIVGAPEYARELIGEDAIAEARSLADDAISGLARGLASALP